MIKAAAVAAALAAVVAPASAIHLYSYSHTESPGSVFETDFEGVPLAGTFTVTIPSPAGCATLGFDVDAEGSEDVATIGTLTEGQSVRGLAYGTEALSDVVRAASRPGCVGLPGPGSYSSSDSMFVLSHKVTDIPAGKFARVTFTLAEGTSGNGVSYTGEGVTLGLTSSVELLDSFGCDPANAPEQCLHAQRAPVPEAHLTSEATGGRVTATSARKCVTLAIIPDDGLDHQAECNFETTIGGGGETKRA